MILLFVSQSASHGGAPCSQVNAWAMAHKGKATSAVDFNPEDPPSAYSNPSIQSRLTEYTTAAKAVHGPEYDPSTQDFEGDLVMRVGGGKKHGRYWLGDSVVDTATTPTLSQIRASDTGQRPPIRPRPTSTQHAMQTLQVITLLFVVHCFLHTFDFHCNIGVKFCRPS